MTTTELLQDGTVVAHALAAPGRGIAEAAERRRALTALCLATAASLVFAAVALPRLDYEAAARARVRGAEALEQTQFQREEAVATARKLGHITGWAGAALAPTLLAAGAAVLLFAGFRVAGTRPGFKETYAVAAHGMLPIWLAGLLAIPAVLARAPLPPDDLPRLLPSSLAAIVPRAAPPLVAALSAVDLFALWAVALVATGMARASGASRARAFTVTLVLYAACVALLKVVPVALLGGPGGGP
ncbi:MAG TPA: YIP1 family protein [Anaeromyxobacter sp.]|nr:YIP1 family protein [Anaeromyxobacter sp.]